MRTAAWIARLLSILRWRGGPDGSRCRARRQCSTAGRRLNSPTDWGTRDISESHAVLRSHQLSPGLHLAAVHGLGFAGRVSRRTTLCRLRAPDAERRSDVGAGSGFGDGIIVRRICTSRWAAAAATRFGRPPWLLRRPCAACSAWIGTRCTTRCAWRQTCPLGGTGRNFTMCRSEIHGSSCSLRGRKIACWCVRDRRHAEAFCLVPRNRAARPAVLGAGRRGA